MPAIVASPSVQNKVRKRLSLEGKPRPDLFVTPTGEALFVPSDDLLLVHFNSKPKAILARAGLHPGDFNKWLDRAGDASQELAAYLYHVGEWPRNYVRRRSGPGSVMSRLLALSGDENATKGMQRFRDESSLGAILKACVRSEAQQKAKWTSRYGVCVSYGLPAFWLNKVFPGIAWMEGFVKRGEEPPKGVTIPEPKIRRECREAWDFAAISADAGQFSGDNYANWIEKGLIPSLGWRKYIFGHKEPEGSFVVTKTLQKLRTEMAVRNICKAAFISRKTAADWLDNPQLKKDLSEAIRIAASFGPQGEKSYLDGVSQVPSNSRERRTRGLMWRYACAARLAACCERAGITVQNYEEYRQRANRYGVLGHLERYMSTHGKKGSRCGLIAPNFFVPSPGMLKFREAAMARPNVWGYRNLPAFDDWFLAWTNPGKSRGRLTTKTFSNHPGRDQATNGEPAPTELAPAPAADLQGKPTLKVRGRKPGWKDGRAKERADKLVEDWRAGKFDSVAALAKAHHMSRSRASQILSKAGLSANRR